MNSKREDERPSDELKSDYYFDAGDAWNDVRSASGTAETAGATVKLLGKSLFNISLFSGKLAWAITKSLPDHLAGKAQTALNKNPDMPEDQQTKLRSIIEKRDEFQAKREALIDQNDARKEGES